MRGDEGGKPGDARDEAPTSKVKCVTRWRRVPKDSTGYVLLATSHARSIYARIYTKGGHPQRKVNRRASD